MQAPRRVSPMLAEPVPRPVQTPGCKGRSPRQNKLIVSPFPQGRGSGDGGRSKAKGRVGRRPRGQAPSGHLSRRFSPCRFRLRRGDARGEAPCIRKLKISPFPGGEGGRGDGARKQATGRVSRQQRGRAPSGYLSRRFSPCRFRLRRGDARGEAPCMRKL